MTKPAAIAGCGVGRSRSHVGAPNPLHSFLTTHPSLPTPCPRSRYKTCKGERCAPCGLHPMHQRLPALAHCISSSQHRTLQPPRSSPPLPCPLRCRARPQVCGLRPRHAPQRPLHVLQAHHVFGGRSERAVQGVPGAGRPLRHLQLHHRQVRCLQDARTVLAGPRSGLQGELELPPSSLTKAHSVWGWALRHHRGTHDVAVGG